MLSFVDACDKIKISMHLHSFTYDFHLRCIHSYIAGNSQWSLKHSYHITNFLDDFNKYYSKAPNYARNLIHSGMFFFLFTLSLLLQIIFRTPASIKEFSI